MLADKPWKLDAALRLFLGVITTFCLGMLVSSLLIPSGPGASQTRVAFWQIVLSACSLEIPALFWIAFFLRQHNVSWKDAFGLHATSAVKAVAFGLLAATLFLPVAMGYRQLSESVMDLAHFNPQDQAAVQTLQDPGLTVTQKTVLGVIMVVLAPIVEEALFRGILYPAIKQRGWPRLALWGTSTLFALAHFNMVTFLPLLFFALVLVYLYETFQNLLVPVVTHAVFNAVNFLTLIFMDQLQRVFHLT